MERKTLAIGIIVIIAIAAGVTGAVVFFMTQPAKEEKVLRLGQMYLPFTLDPQDAWDSASNNVITQVVEGLYGYNYSDPNLGKIPVLASAWGEWDGSHTVYTVPLRTGVKFHDGSDFNADDVVFTFERLEYFYNFTGLNTGYIPTVKELHEFPNGTQIIKDVAKVDDTHVKFELNGVYGPFEDLLCYVTSAILTSTFYNKTGDCLVDLDGGIMGTGPFVFERFELDVEVELSANKNYWRGAPKLDRALYVGIIDAQARNAALLAGDINYLYSPMDEMWDVFEEAEGITLYKEGQTAVVQYLQLNCEQISLPWRLAISFAFDYDYLVETIRYDHCDRLKSAVGFGIKYYNDSFTQPNFNVTAARMIVQSLPEAIAVDPTVVSWNATYDGEANTKFNLDETKWRTTVFKAFNYSYNIGNNVREDVYILLISCLSRIGVLVTDAGSTWATVLDKQHESHGHTRDELQLLFIGWGPDFNDPLNFINPLFTNRSVASNGGKYNGYLQAAEAGRDPFDLNDNVQLLMEEAMFTPDGPAREKLYDRIQELLIADCPWVFGYSGQGPPWAFADTVHNIPYNAMGNYDLYPIDIY